jgi:hypothetical protein
VRRRRRYEVVVEGLSGQAASHRSVLSEHRSETEALESASLERSRLEVIYGENAGNWRVLVLRDDELVHTETPASAADLASITGDIPVQRAPEEVSDEADATAPGAEAEAEVEPEEEAAPPAEPSPEGPVPDWVLAKFEESIARRGEREDAPEAPD